MRFGMGVAQGISSELAARVAADVFVTPRRGRRSERESVWLRSASPLLLAVDGQPVAAWQWGPEDGPAVLLVHGWQGRGAQLGALAAPLVAAGCRVITFDGPAHGASPGRRMTLVDLARAVMAAAQAAGGALQGVAAHSFGAAAVTLALSRGLRAERVAYLAPAADVESAVRRFVRWARLGGEAEAEFRRRLEHRAGVPIAEIDGLTLAPTMHTPLLVLHDEDDREVPLREGEALAARWPGATFLRTGGLGHHVLLRDPDAVGRVTAWLASGVAATPFLEELERELFKPSLRRTARGR